MSAFGQEQRSQNAQQRTLVELILVARIPP
jgi:hypothetical protein